MYVFFDKNVEQMATAKLRSCQVDLSHIDFIEFYSQKFNLETIILDDRVLEDLILKNYHFIYMDSCEDLGIMKIEKILSKVVE